MSISKRTAVERACSGLRGQACRMVRYIDANPGALTGAVASSCAIGNVSDAARKANRELERYGFRILAKLPKPLSENRFGERSQQHEWRIERAQ